MKYTQYFASAVILAVVLLLGVPRASAQSGTVTGKVVSAGTGEVLPAATVILQKEGVSDSGPKLGRRSLADGSFILTPVDPGDYTIRVSYIGYKPFKLKVKVEADKTTDVTLKLIGDVRGMEDVVVTGEAQKRFKSDAEVSVSKVNVAELTQTQTYEDLTQVLSGKTPGVRITPGSGTAGGGVRFDIRSGGGLNGSGQPVIYVDGVRIPNGEIGNGLDLTGGQAFSSISDLNPDDIANVQVLKGPAAAALYGTSGANGVILITTKRGDRNVGTGSGPIFQYKATSGWNEQATAYTTDLVLTADAANATFRKGLFSEHELSLSGSNSLFSYYASFGRRNEDGITYNNSFERNSMRANFSAYPMENLTINASTNYVVNNATLPQNDNNILGNLGGTLIFGPTSVGGLGTYAGADSILGISINTANSSRRFLGSIEGIYTPVSGLTLRGLLGYDGLSYRLDQLFPASLDYSAFGVIGGQKSISNAFEDRLNIDLSGAYSWDLAEDVNSTTTLGTQLFYSTITDFNIAKQNFPTDIVSNIGVGEKLISGDESLTSARTAGLYLLEDFSINNTYFLSAGVRNEYASAVGTAAPSIFYPRAGASVRLDRLGITPEDFNLFKFRVAYGQSGILPSPLQASGLRWGAEASGSGRGAVIVSIGNEAIEPERIGELEIGLDLEYENLYGLELTYYMQHASNSILNFTNAPSTGLTASSTPRNVGQIDGSGFEASLYGRVINTADYTLDLNLIWNYGKNKVTSLGGAPPIFSGENAIYEGQPRSAFYTFAVRKALFNGDGTYAGPDQDTARSFLGNPVAPSTGSFSINFKFLKNFTLNVLTDWSFGGTMHNLTRQFQTYYGNDPEYNKLINQLGLQGNANFIFPTVFGDSNIAPLTPGSPEYIAAANRLAELDPNSPGAVGYFESTDFIRLREIGLRYDLTDALGDILPGRDIKSLAVAVGVRNVAWLMKSYSEPDVELSTQGSTYTVYRGQDFLTLQNPRVFYGSLFIGF